MLHIKFSDLLILLKKHMFTIFKCVSNYFENNKGSGVVALTQKCDVHVFCPFSSTRRSNINEDIWLPYFIVTSLESFIVQHTVKTL